MPSQWCEGVFTYFFFHKLASKFQLIQQFKNLYPTKLTDAKKNQLHHIWTICNTKNEKYESLLKLQPKRHEAQKIHQHFGQDPFCSKWPDKPFWYCSLLVKNWLRSESLDNPYWL